MDNQPIAPSEAQANEAAPVVAKQTPIDRHPIPVLIAFLIIVSIGGFALWTTDIGSSSGQSTTNTTLPH